MLTEVKIAVFPASDGPTSKTADFLVELRRWVM